MTELGTPEEADNALAAEYVIGVLPAEDRVALKTRLRQDAAFAGLVELWQEHLSGFNPDFGSQPAPKHIKTKIDRRLFGAQNRRAWLSGAFWGALAASVLAGVLLVSLSLGLSEPGLQATLESDDTPYRFVVQVEPGEEEATVTLASGELPPDRTFELWLLQDQAAPVSLGVFGDATRFDLTRTERLVSGQTLAVSLEPVGGSPTGAPTGPVLAVGELIDA